MKEYQVSGLAMGPDEMRGLLLDKYIRLGRVPIRAALVLRRLDRVKF